MSEMLTVAIKDIDVKLNGECWNIIYIKKEADEK